MDGIKSFYPTLEAGMNYVLESGSKVAYFQNVEYVHSFKKTHCKVSILAQSERSLGISNEISTLKSRTSISMFLRISSTSTFLLGLNV